MATFTDQLADLAIDWARYKAFGSAGPRRIAPMTQAPALPGPVQPAPVVIDNVTGKVTRCDQYGNPIRRRRRRRRLATASDIKDLGALKGVLGMGKAFELWIATHGS